MTGILGKALSGAATAVQPVAMEGLRASILAERDARLQQYKAAEFEETKRHNVASENIGMITAQAHKATAEAKDDSAYFPMRTGTDDMGNPVFTLFDRKTGKQIQGNTGNDPFGLRGDKAEASNAPKPEKTKTSAQPSPTESPSAPKSDVDKSLEIAFGYIGQRPRGSSFFIDAPARSPLASLKDKPFASPDEAKNAIREFYSGRAK